MICCQWFALGPILQMIGCICFVYHTVGCVTASWHCDVGQVIHLLVVIRFIGLPDDDVSCNTLPCIFMLKAVWLPGRNNFCFCGVHCYNVHWYVSVTITAAISAYTKQA